MERGCFKRRRFDVRERIVPCSNYEMSKRLKRYFGENTGNCHREITGLQKRSLHEGVASTLLFSSSDFGSDDD